MENLALIGAGGACRTIIDAVYEINRAGGRWRIAGIVDDDPAKAGKEFYRGTRVLGGREAIKKIDPGEIQFLVTFSSPATFLSRLAYVESLRRDFAGIRFATLIHPAAFVSETASVGAGSFIGAGAVLDAEASVGEHVIVLFHTVLGRRAQVGGGTFISASVNVTTGHKVGSGVYLGAKTMIHADVGDNVLVAAGAVIRKAVTGPAIVNSIVEENVVPFDSPARMQMMLGRMTG